MAEKLVAQRRARLLELQEQRDLLDKHLRDGDWIERVNANADFKRLCQLFREEMEATVRPKLVELEQRLRREPMAPDERVKMSECVMLMNRDFENLENFIGFPQKELERLSQCRKELPSIENQIEALKQQEESNHGG